MTDEHPTNQFPAAAPEPTGIGDPPPHRRSRRGLIAVVVAVVVVLGAGIGVAVAVGTDSDGGKPLGAPSSTTAGSPGAATSSGSNNNGTAKKGKGKNGKGQKNNVIRGTITAESGSTWTVKTLRGTTTRVTVGANTKFGTKQAPMKAADFPVGRAVAIAGSPASDGGTITARRIRTPAVKGQGKTGGSATPSPTPSPTTS